MFNFQSILIFYQSLLSTYYILYGLNISSFSDIYEGNIFFQHETCPFLNDIFFKAEEFNLNGIQFVFFFFLSVSVLDVLMNSCLTQVIKLFHVYFQKFYHFKFNFMSMTYLDISVYDLRWQSKLLFLYFFLILVYFRERENCERSRERDSSADFLLSKERKVGFNSMTQKIKT